MLRTLGVIGAVAASLGVFTGVAESSAPAPDGAKIYMRCAACHLPTGKGVNAVFPPLKDNFRALAATPEGRKYLALVVIKGMSGPVKIAGKPYKNVMPPQPMDDASIAAVLNHVGTNVATTGPAFKELTAAEVAAARKSGKSLTAAKLSGARPASAN